MSLPRLLFVTPCAFNKVTGGGITFTNLFSGWPKDRIAAVHSDSVPVTTDVCAHYWRMGVEEEHGYLTHMLRVWIAAFAPQLIYTPLGYLPLLTLVENIRREFNIPLAVHFMDDYPAAIRNPVYRWRVRRALRSLVRQASAAFAISDMMAEEYAVLYGRPFTVFHNAVDVARFGSLENP